MPIGDSTLRKMAYLQGKLLHIMTKQEQTQLEEFSLVVI